MLSLENKKPKIKNSLTLQKVEEVNHENPFLPSQAPSHSTANDNY